MSAAAPTTGRTQWHAATGMAASRWLHPVLHGPSRPVRVVWAGPHATYVGLGADRTVLAIEAPSGARLPVAVRLARPPALRPGAPGTVGGGRLRIGSLDARVGRWWDPRPRLVQRADPAALRRHRGALPQPDGAHLARHGLAGPVAALADAGWRRDAAAADGALDALLGRGPGSTPSGDDVVAGLLATLVALGPPTGPVVDLARSLAAGARRRAHRTTPLSATLLRCAADGAVAADAGRVLALLAAPSGATAALRPAVAALARLGHTSGRDLLTGIAIGVEILTADRSPA